MPRPPLAADPAERRTRVDQAFQQWRVRAAELERHTRLMEEALDAYGRGTGPLPSRLIEEVAAMRQLVQLLFEELKDAVRAQKE